jgi:antigen 43
MAAKSFTHVGGGNWNVGSNWTPTGEPGAADDVSIGALGGPAFTVTITDPGLLANTFTLNNANATFSIASGGGLILGATPTMALDVGTLVLGGVLLGESITNSGVTLAFSGGTLDGVVWQGALALNNGGSINIKDGITLLNAGGTTPGTLAMGSNSFVNITDSNTLDNMLITTSSNSEAVIAGASSLPLNIGTATEVSATGTDSTFVVQGGTLINLGGLTLEAGGGDVFLQSRTFDNAGSVLIGGGDNVAISQNFSFTNTASIAVTSNGTFSIPSQTIGPVSNTGSIGVSAAGTLVSTATSIAGAGTITLASFALADVENLGGTVDFLDGSRATLKLEAASTIDFSGLIENFSKGNTIDLVNVTSVTTLDYSGTSSGGTLQVIDSGATLTTLGFSGDFTHKTFNFQTDGAGTGTDVIIVSCYAADARILTAQGEVAAGSLREGDLVATASGALKPVRWIGRSGIDLGQHPQPESAAPIRIRAGAFAPGLPYRDLLVSPDHSVLAADSLIPARYLVNGSTIVREPAAGTADYVHVEVDRHSILLAEGLPAESYLDTGNRAAFPGQAQIRRHA